MRMTKALPYSCSGVRQTERIMVGAHKIYIGESYRNRFFDDFISKNILFSNK